jgi:hypothetical protein
MRGSGCHASAPRAILLKVEARIDRSRIDLARDKLDLKCLGERLEKLLTHGVRRLGLDMDNCRPAHDARH